MKFINKLTAGLVGMGLFATVFAQAATPASGPIKFELPKTGGTTPAPASTPAPATPAAPAAPAIKYTQAQLLEVFGYILASQSRMPQLEFSVADVDSISKGMKLALSGEKPPYANDDQNIGTQYQEFMGQKQQAFMVKVRDLNIADGTAFFAKLNENKSVQILPSGLGVEVVKAASGKTVKAGQVAKFHFVLSSLGGQTIESTAGQEPIEALVQEGGMIPGLVEGLQKIPVGAKYKLYVPYKLGYGEQGGGGMPPAASLIFEIEMIDIKDAPKDTAPAK